MAASCQLDRHDIEEFIETYVFLMKKDDDVFFCDRDEVRLELYLSGKKGLG